MRCYFKHQHWQARSYPLSSDSQCPSFPCGVYMYPWAAPPFNSVPANRGEKAGAKLRKDQPGANNKLPSNTLTCASGRPQQVEIVPSNNRLHLRASSEVVLLREARSLASIRLRLNARKELAAAWCMRHLRTRHLLPWRLLKWQPKL